MLAGSDIVYAGTGGAGAAALTALSTQTGSTLWSFQDPLADAFSQSVNP